MIVNKKSLFTLLFILQITVLYAQYVPKSKRAATPIDKVPVLKIAAGQKLTITQPVVYCDSLIMENGAILKIDSVESFTLFAKHLYIGEKCVIDASGKDGKEGTYTNIHGEWATNAINLNLYLNIYALGSLKIDATGGNGGFGYDVRHSVPGVHGAGGNVQLQYYAPFAVGFRKPRRKKKGDASIHVKTNRGSMDTGKLRRLSATKNPDLAGKNAQPLREVAHYDERSGKMITRYVMNNQNPMNKNPHAASRDSRTSYNRIQTAKLADMLRKDGKFSFSRKETALSPADVDIK